MLQLACKEVLIFLHGSLISQFSQ